MHAPKHTHAPALRFPEFSDNWEVKKLGEVAKFSKGKGVSKNDIAENGKTECIRYGELYTIYHETISEVKSRTNVEVKNLVLSEANDVIIPSSGESEIEIATASCVLKSGVALGGDLNIIKTKNNGVFISYYLNNIKKYDISKLAQGTSVVHLYSTQLALLDLNLPTLPEQTKIGNFLTAVDTKIQGLRKEKALLEQYKKGMMQRIFSQTLRFKDAANQDFPNWEVKKLGEVMQVAEKIKPHVIDKEKLLTVKLHLKGLHKNASTESLSIGATSYFIRKKGQFIYGKQNLFNGAFGIVSEEFDGYLTSTDVPALDVDTQKVNTYFLFYFFARESYYKKLEEIASGSGSKRIQENVFLNIEIQLPTLPEQTKIANFLSAIDEKIRNCAERLEKMEAWKKGLLQQMFV